MHFFKLMIFVPFVLTVLGSLSLIVHKINDNIAQKYSSVSHPDLTVDVDTVGFFNTTSVLTIKSNQGWLNNATKFTSFHMRPNWYSGNIFSKGGKEISDINQKQKLDSRTEEFYVLRGGKVISNHLECPNFTVCLFTATWKNSTWEISRTLFRSVEKKYPTRIKKVFDYDTTTSNQHQLIIAGPKSGKIKFNALKLGIRFKSGSFMVTRSGSTAFLLIKKLTPLYLPSGIPDGIIGFSN